MMSSKRAEDRGQSIVEFAILIPVFIALVMGAVALAELGIARIKTFEVARYAAFSVASKPLSDFSERKHNRLFDEARSQARLELLEHYGPLGLGQNLQSGTQGSYLQSRLNIASAVVRQERVQYVDANLNASWAEPLSAAGVILNILGIGTDLNTMAAGMHERLGFNDKAQLIARPQMQTASENLKASSTNRLAALKNLNSQTRSNTRSFIQNIQRRRNIRDAQGQRIQLMLIADPWRANDGSSTVSTDNDHPLTQTVAYIDNGDRAIRGLPGGNALGIIYNIFLNEDFPAADLLPIVGIPVHKPSSKVLSRPYAMNRHLRKNSKGPIQNGQIDIFKYTNAQVTEENAVQNFETMPFFDDPNNLSDSGYAESFKQRGPHFMGCRESEKRGCW